MVESRKISRIALFRSKYMVVALRHCQRRMLPLGHPPNYISDLDNSNKASTHKQR